MTSITGRPTSTDSGAGAVPLVIGLIVVLVVAALGGARWANRVREPTV